VGEEGVAEKIAGAAADQGAAWRMCGRHAAASKRPRAAWVSRDVVHGACGRSSDVRTVDTEIEGAFGIHGEPGRQRMAMQSAGRLRAHARARCSPISTLGDDGVVCS